MPIFLAFETLLSNCEQFAQEIIAARRLRAKQPLLKKWPNVDCLILLNLMKIKPEPIVMINWTRWMSRLHRQLDPVVAALAAPPTLACDEIVILPPFV
jgi:hypothetical protein